jgi:hypothetical protein
MLADYTSGEKIAAIASKFGIRTQQVNYFARTRGLPLRCPELSACQRIARAEAAPR